MREVAGRHANATGLDTMRTNSRRMMARGFTLMEISTVLAIIGVLAAIAVPVISRAKWKALDIQCQSNLRQHGVALLSFVGSHGVFPLSVNPSKAAGVMPEHAVTFYGSLKAEGLGELPAKFPWKEPSVYLCPSAQRQKLPPQIAGELAMYGYNAVGLEGERFPPLGLGFMRSEELAPVPESEVRVPAEMIALGDGVVGRGDIYQDGASMVGRLSSAAEVVGSSVRVGKRHSGRVNLIYCDGHVGSPVLSTLFASAAEGDLIGWNRDHQAHRERVE